MAKNSLAEAMTRIANRTPNLGRTEIPTSAIATKPTDREENLFRAREGTPKTQRTKSRIGKKVISGFFDPQVSKQLARLAIDQDRTNEDLLREALNDLFSKYRLPPIA